MWREDIYVIIRAYVPSLLNIFLLIAALVSYSVVLVKNKCKIRKRGTNKIVKKPPRSSMKVTKSISFLFCPRVFFSVSFSFFLLLCCRDIAGLIGILVGVQAMIWCCAVENW